MKNKNYISFPPKEYLNYQQRLDNNKVIYTTRVSKEVSKYKLNETYSSVFGDLKVVSIKHYNSLENHPFLDELTQEQILEINKYIDKNGYDLIALEKV